MIGHQWFAIFVDLKMDEAKDLTTSRSDKTRTMFMIQDGNNQVNFSLDNDFTMHFLCSYP